MTSHRRTTLLLPGTRHTAATMDSDEDSLTLHDDTVYDTAYDNVYDVYYDVHEETDVDYGDGPWSDGIG